MTARICSGASTSRTRQRDPTTEQQSLIDDDSMLSTSASIFIALSFTLKALSSSCPTHHLYCRPTLLVPQDYLGRAQSWTSFSLLSSSVSCLPGHFQLTYLALYSSLIRVAKISNQANTADRNPSF